MYAILTATIQLREQINVFNYAAKRVGIAAHQLHRDIETIMPVIFDIANSHIDETREVEQCEHDLMLVIAQLLKQYDAGVVGCELDLFHYASRFLFQIHEHDVANDEPYWNARIHSQIVKIAESCHDVHTEHGYLQNAGETFCKNLRKQYKAAETTATTNAEIKADFLKILDTVSLMIDAQLTTGNVREFDALLGPIGAIIERIKEGGNI